MFLKSLELENIRSYRREKIEFGEGITLFEGDIGSGKSTILYAIEFALFGLGDLKSTFLLRNGEKEGTVRLIMDAGAGEISFVRSLERKKGGASQKQCRIIAAGTKTDYSPEEMKAEVLKLLKFNENPSPAATSLIYRYAIFTPQEEMKEILRLREDMRLETLRRAFGIEEYRIARNNAALVSRGIKERETFLRGGLKDLGSVLAEEKEKLALLEQCKKNMAECGQRKDALGRKRSLLREKIEGLRNVKASLEKILGEIPVLKKRRGDKLSLIRELEQALSKEDAEIAEKKRRVRLLESGKKPSGKTEEEIEEELKIAREKIRMLAAEIGALEQLAKDAQAAGAEAKKKEQELKIIEAEISSLGNISKPTEKTDSGLLQEIAGMRVRADRLLRESGAAKEHCETLKKLIMEEACPTCGQKIEPEEFRKKSGDAKKAAASLEEELKALFIKEKSLESLREELAGCNFKKEKLSGLLREKDMLGRAYGDERKKNSELERLQKLHSKKSMEQKSAVLAEKELSEVLAALSAYRQARLESIRIHAEINSAGIRLDSDMSMRRTALGEVSEIDAEISGKEKEVRGTEPKLLELEELEREAERLRKTEEELAEETGTALAMHKSLESELKRIRTVLKEKDAEKKELEELAGARMWLDDYFVNSLASIERHVLRSINDQFNAMFRRLFGILMDESGLNVSINEFFTPAVVQNGYEQDINSLSGGERTSVALAYRLALNSIVKAVCGSMDRSSLLILDEPTDGFGKEQLMRLRDVLAELACRQVIIVSHEKELESFADRVFRVRKSGSVSAVEN